ncbi:MAG: Hsp20 family protein [Candidatus Bathyarchaeia archaeon]
MPGVAKDKIDVALTKDGIEISAETDVEKEDKEKNFVVRERVYSHIYKQLSFPEEVILRKLNPHLGTDYLKSASQRRRLHQPLKSTKSQ